MSLEAVLNSLHAEGVPVEKIPKKKPAILIQPSHTSFDSVQCDELQWWFLVPQPGKSALAFKYDLETDDLSMIEHLACGGAARVHQTDCLECTIRTWSMYKSWRCDRATWYCALTASQAIWLAVITQQDSLKELSTFKDEDFYEQWGDVGPRRLADTGRFQAIGPDTYTMQEGEGMGAGTFDVQVGEKVFTCLRVLDIGPQASEYEEIGEVFINREGRVVLYRQYWGRFMGGEQDWCSVFPNNPRLTINGCVYVQRNCTGRCHDLLTGTALGIG